MPSVHSACYLCARSPHSLYFRPSRLSRPPNTPHVPAPHLASVLAWQPVLFLTCCCRVCRHSIFPRPLSMNSHSIGCGSPQTTQEDNAGCRWQAEPMHSGSQGRFVTKSSQEACGWGGGARFLERLRATLMYFLRVSVGQESGQGLQSRCQWAAFSSAGRTGVPAFRLMQDVGRKHFLEAVRTEACAPCRQPRHGPRTPGGSFLEASR